MKLLSYLAFLVCLEGLTFGVFALCLNPREVLNHVGAGIGLLHAWWNFCLVFVYGSDDPATALFFDHLSYVAVLGLNPALAWYFLRFAEVPNRVILGLLAPVCAVFLLVFYRYAASGFPYTAFQPGPWGNVGVPAADQTWATVSDVASLGLAAVCFFVLARGVTRSWRAKRLVRWILAGIVAIACSLILSAVGKVYGIPQLSFLLSAVLVAMNFYIISQYGFLRPEEPLLERHLAEALTEPVVLLDKEAKVVGANQAARQRLFAPGQDPVGRDFALWLDSPDPFRAQWAEAKTRDGQAAILLTAQGPLRLSAHYDRFGDFIGAVALFAGSAEPPSELAYLSSRETEVLNLIVAGHGNQAIASRLFISRDTVKSHVHALLAKTGTRNRQELLRVGGRIG